MNYPLSTVEVAKLCGCTPRTVQNWAAKNSVRAIGGGNRAQYIFFEADITRFRERERPGRRWHRDT
jgi:DNA-binding transcriptional MerR regulator